MKYLKLKEVCELLSVHPNTLRNWDNDGTLKAKRLPNGDRRWKEADIIDFIENGSNRKG